MSEQTLIEAFRRLVLQDADFLKAIDEASDLAWPDQERFRVLPLREGLFPSALRLWPVSIDPAELRPGLFDPAPLKGTPPLGSAKVSQAEAALQHALRLADDVAAVFRRFLEPLQSGSLQARGFTSASTVIEIPRAIWQRHTTLIDPIAGEVGRLAKSHEQGSASEPSFMPEWTAVSISKVKKLPSSPTRDRSRGKLAWDAALDNVLFGLCTGRTYTDTDGLIEDVLSVINNVNGDTDETQVMRHFRTFYPKFWALLKGE